jgi:flagellar basal-body rod protein FlgB
MPAFNQHGVTEVFASGFFNASATIPGQIVLMGTQIGLFDLAEKRLAWVDQRQTLLAQNIANANTPGFQAKDVASFAQTLGQVAPDLVRTNAMHLTGPASKIRNDARQRPHERAIDGNAVSMEEQLTKVADTEGAQSLTENLYHKYMGLFRLSIGK